MKRSGRSRQTTRDKILARIERRHGGSFVAKDFLDVASRGSVDVTLAALAQAGTIRRVRRGLYDAPKVSGKLGGQLSPNIDAAALAMARRFRWKIIPEGAWAANLVGLSTQVPAKIVYLSDGPNKKVAIGRRVIQFKHARPQALAGGRGKSALVVQALRHLGSGGVDTATKLRLRRTLSDAERRQLLKAARGGVDWIYGVAKELAQESP